MKPLSSPASALCPSRAHGSPRAACRSTRCICACAHQHRAVMPACTLTAATPRTAENIKDKAVNMKLVIYGPKPPE